MGLSGLEPPTSRLSGVRSNRLSYKPILFWQPPTFPYRLQYSIIGRKGLNHRVRYGYGCVPFTHRHQKTFVILDNSTIRLPLLLLPYKGGDPAAPSDTATLLRLHPSHRLHLRQLLPFGSVTDFGHIRLPWCDGRCVQDPGTYSPQHSDLRLLAIPASCSRVADYNPN